MEFTHNKVVNDRTTFSGSAEPNHNRNKNDRTISPNHNEPNIYTIRTKIGLFFPARKSLIVCTEDVKLKYLSSCFLLKHKFSQPMTNKF